MSIILGGGISGLAAGHYLKKRTIKPITILEASNRVGGWIKSTLVGTTVYEAGPRTIRPRGAKGENTLELLEELGLEDILQPISRDHPAAKNRMIFTKKDKLCLLPSSLSGIFRVNPPFSQSMFRMILNDFNGTQKKIEDQSIYDFVSRRFGTELADYIVSPVICGICAGDAKEISVKFLMKSLFETEQKYGSVIMGSLMASFGRKKQSDPSPLVLKNLITKATTEKWSIYTICGGLEMLPQKLAQSLQKRDVDILTETVCNRVNLRKDECEVYTDGKMFTTERVISSLPAHHLAPVVRDQHPHLANELEKIPYADVVVINLKYNSANLLAQPGFGVLVPPNQDMPVLGIIFDSCCFDLPDQTVLTVMISGKWLQKESPNCLDNDEYLTELAVKNVETILGIRETPDNVKVNVLRKCIPQYIVGHEKVVERIQAYVKEHNLPLTLCGTYIDGVGINDAIISAREAVKNLSHSFDYGIPE